MAIQEFVDTRYEAYEMECACYHIFIDTTKLPPDPEPHYFESEQECLNAYQPPTEQTIRCIKDVLETGPYTEAGNIELMECYTDKVEADMACFAEKVAGTCSASAYESCQSATFSDYYYCGQALSQDQTDAIAYCILD